MHNPKKRPYGLSYDGKVSTRKLTRYLQPSQKQFNPTKNSLIQCCNHPIKIQNIQGIPQTIKSNKKISQMEEKTSNEFMSMNPSIENQKIRRQLNYISKFLNFEHQIKEDQELSLDESQTKIRWNKVQLSDQAQKIKEQSTIFQVKQTHEIHKQRQISSYKCPCGKTYRMQGYLVKHFYNKHCGKIPQQIIKKDKLSSKRAIKIKVNWLLRICQNLSNLNITIQELDQQIGKSDQILIQLNKNIESQKVFLQFFQSFHHSYAKLAIFYLIMELRKFFRCHEQFQKIWVLDFLSVPLIANPFYGWLKEQKSELQISKNPCYPEFISQMFLLFNQWSYANQLSEILLTKNLKLNPKKID